MFRRARDFLQNLQACRVPYKGCTETLSHDRVFLQGYTRTLDEGKEFVEMSELLGNDIRGLPENTQSIYLSIQETLPYREGPSIFRLKLDLVLCRRIFPFYHPLNAPHIKIDKVDHFCPRVRRLIADGKGPKEACITMCDVHTKQALRCARVRFAK